jgi:hypothetical protein
MPAWGDLINTLQLRGLAVDQAQQNIIDSKQLAALRGIETQLYQQKLQDRNISQQAFAKALADGAATQSPDNTINPDDTPLVSAQKEARRLQQQSAMWNNTAAEIIKSGGNLDDAHKLQQDSLNASNRSRQLLMEARREQSDYAKQMGSIAGGVSDDPSFQVAMRQLRALDPKIDSRYPFDRDDQGNPVYGDRSQSVMRQIGAAGIDAGKMLDDTLKLADAKRKTEESESLIRERQAKERELNARTAKIRAGVPGTPEYKRAEEAGGPTGGGQPGGVGSELMQDPQTGQRYAINKRTGKAWELDEEGKWKAANLNTIPKTIVPIGKTGVMGSREAVFTQRQILAANEAAKDLTNVAKLPLSVSTGVFGGRTQGPTLLGATKEVLANNVTSQEVQIYNTMATGFQRSLATIEAAGLMPSGKLTGQMDQVLLKEGDTNLTKLSKLAQIRQIVEAGMEVILTNPRASDAEKEQVRKVVEQMKQAVPYTQSDVLKLLNAEDPQETLLDIMPKKGGGGLPVGWSVREKR